MTDSGALEGKVVLVTGGGHGIGREIALLAANEGASVVVNDLGSTPRGDGQDAGAAEEVVSLIERSGGRAAANGGDVSSFADARAMVQQAVDTFGRIDAIASIAGISRDAAFHKMTEQDFDRVVQVNLKGSFNVARAAADFFRPQMSGAMLHTTSTAGLIGYRGMANYAAAKMGIVGLSRTIALDMARFNVRSNCLAPHAWSRMSAQMVARTPEEQKRVERQKAMNADKMAPLSIYLLSDLAAGITGQVFGARQNELYLYNQPRQVRSVHREAGWSVQDIHQHAMPAMRQFLTSLDDSSQVIGWDPI
jgi:NAD(P)-dependent dehydrogenase (short-subunit alcohol dehydrogenase family)